MRVHRIQAILLKYWYFSKADLARVFDMLFWPTIGVIVFGLTTTYLEGISQLPSVVLFLLGGLIIWTLFERVQQDVTIFVLEDFWSNNIANLFTTPLTRAELFTALIIIGFIRSVLTSTVMFGLAFILYHFNVIGGNLMALLFAIPLLLFGWALGILITGAIFRFGQRIQIFAWGVAYLLQPVSAVFYPLAALPLALQYVARATPLAYILEGYRAAYAGGFSWPLFVTAVVLAFVYMGLGYLYFVYAVEYSRKKGTLAKY